MEVVAHQNPVCIGVIAKSSVNVTPALIKYPKKYNSVAYVHLNLAISAADCTCFINLSSVQYPNGHQAGIQLEELVNKVYIPLTSEAQ